MFSASDERTVFKFSFGLGDEDSAPVAAPSSSSQPEGFRFNFNFGGDDVAPSSSVPSSVPTPAEAEDSGTWRPALKHLPKEAVSVPADIEEIDICGHGIKKVKLRPQADLGEERISALTRGSDLEPGLYEGGFKLWECAVDLSRYLCSLKAEEAVKEKVVFEAGCGHALPGILALLLGAKRVDMHDYNHEVITRVTMQNVALNTEGKDISGEIDYYSGDWQTFPTTFPEVSEQGYDLILTADTLYSTQAVTKLHSLICTTLKSNGVAYVCAKAYYFGCIGNGVKIFCDMIDAEKQLTWEIVHKISDGASNIREILAVKKRIAE